MQTQKLFKIDSKGLLRQWYAVVEESDSGKEAYTTQHSGRVGGKLVSSKPKVIKPKNVGHKNETTPLEQAKQEVASLVKKKCEQEGYSFSVEDAKKNYNTFAPMLAKGYEEEKDKVWVDAPSTVRSQPKLDGIRCYTTKDGMFTRKHKPITSCPHIIEALARFFEKNPDAILDGELYNHDLKDDFQKLTSLIRKQKLSEGDKAETRRMIQYHVYDMNTPHSFCNRHVRLATNVPVGLFVKLVETTPVGSQAELDKYYGKYLEDGYEGQMVRWGKSGYEFKRTDKLLKRKEFASDEFKVVGVEEGQGNWSGAIKRFHLVTDDGKPFFAGVKGTWDDLQRLTTLDVPSWATVRYFGRSNEGIPRFPVVVDYGFDSRPD